MAVSRFIAGGLLCVTLVSLAGCNGASPKDPAIEPRPFQVRDLAKSDVDLVAETHLRLTLGHLRTLMEKLYRRNPREWRKGGQPGIEAAVERVFGAARPARFPELRGRRSVGSMRLAFEEDFQGDRVLALVEGLRGMVLDAYNGQQEFYLLDELDPQRLYNAARNIEIAVWKLSNDRDAGGRLFFVTNEVAGPIRNLSFERLFGKIIALQDSMAQIVADTTNRRIKNVIQSAASAVFIGI